MPGVAWLAATLFLCLSAGAAEPRRQAPAYSGASIVNAATNETGPLAPLALVSLYGTDLAVVTSAITHIPAADETQKGKVIDEVEKGYKLGDKVIRFAKVVVGA